MTDKALTEIVLIVDRSGSMHTSAEDAEGGINALIKEQQGLDGKANFTLVQFDDQYDFVCEGVDINKVEDYHLVPRGCTALLDAVGQGISETGIRLEAMEESKRPGLVTFVIVTDGGENASKEYTLKQVSEMIKTQQDDYDWQFTFLGAGLDAFTGGAKLGISGASMVNYCSSKTDMAYKMSSSNIGRMRASSMEGRAVCSSYTDEERKSAEA